MLSKTHLIISNNVIDELKKENINIDSKMFKVGNISPDIVKTYVKGRHYMSTSLNSVVERIIELSIEIKEALLNNYSINKILLKLGIISHYISDYFCKPHNFEWKYFEGNTIEHFQYENRQNKKALEINDFNPKNYKIDTTKPEEIKTMIFHLNELYKRQPNEKNDILFAVEACVILILSMFKPRQKTILTLG